ncbi:MAG: ribosome recycling factor [Bacteroidota bacterium]|nr:ribosome recycling factor [Bacteroidota bacterium]MDP3145651.1 ribosome recycling factor [Bacteroidota bacterium]MDP3558674.1 ribosome recycling factor [Bacteroidota bacterium]
MSDINTVLETAKNSMEKAISHLESELQKVRAGKASPAMLENIMVDYYGSMVPLSNTASVNSQDSRTLIVQPWEKSMLTPIEKAIQSANLGFNPQNDGVIIRIMVPALTEERRKQLTKTAKSFGEDAKVGIRTVRKDSMEQIKKLQKDGLPEDEAKSGEAKIQTLTDAASVKVDKHIEQKEKEIMTV